MSISGQSAPEDPAPVAGGVPRPGERLYRFLRIGHILSSALREILEEKYLSEVSPVRLTRAQFCFLKLIAVNPDLQIGEIARCFGVSSAASSKNVDKLERHGLVARSSSPGDRRATLLSASERGQRLLREYEQLKAARIGPVIRAIAPEKIDRLCEWLEEICVGLLEAEQPLGDTCLRCAGYHEPDCSIASIQGGCSLVRHGGGRSGGVTTGGAAGG